MAVSYINTADPATVEAAAKASWDQEQTELIADDRCDWSDADEWDRVDRLARMRVALAAAAKVGAR